MRRTVLLTNDDGIFAEEIRVLRKAIDTVWESFVVAPESEQSAASHALTLNRPLRVRKIDDRTMAVDGTPADCVMLSLEGILRKKPDLVISGINNGGNLGDDVIYSGTVAGAAEATILGVPAIAVSFVDPENTDFEKGALVAIRVAEAVLKNTLPKGVFLNVNIPGHWSGGSYEVTTLGNRPYREVIVEKVDPRGKPYYWIGGQADQWSGGEHCDFAAIERGNVSITPLQLNMTAVQSLQDISNWHM
ncbi:5'/3'-nucleotidase SurE [bacterium]|nr:5'/3'-nucleotidase SurE [bacterium]